MKSEKHRGTHKNPAEKNVLPLTDQISENLKENTSSLLQNGMQNLEADIESALYQVDDALMLLLSTEVRVESLAESLTFLKKHLLRSLHSLRDWRLAVLR